MAVMVSAEQFLSIVSGVIGAVSGVTGSVIAVLSYRAGRQPWRDQADQRRWPGSGWRWQGARLVGVGLACLGTGLAAVTVLGGLQPKIAFAFAIGLLLGSMLVVVMLRHAHPASSGIVAHELGDVPGWSVEGSQPIDDGVEAGLAFEREEASVTLNKGSYQVKVRRWLVNEGREPITGTTIFISVDRFPDHPFRSRRHHRQYPLTLEEVKLSVRLDGRPIRWRTVVDHESSKELWVLFEDLQEHLPLYPGKRALLEYTYSVGMDKWGPFLYRANQRPTKVLVVEVRLPKQLTPKVWGVTKSSSADPEQQVDLTYTVENGFDVYRWQAQNPPMFSSVRIRWHLVYTAS